MKLILFTSMVLFFAHFAFASGSVIQTQANPKRVIRIQSSGVATLKSWANTKTETLTQFLGDIGAYDLSRLKVTEETAKDPGCGDAYFVDVVVHGFWQSVQARVDFYAQTLTKKQQARLYNAIKANYATKGLPTCMLNTAFYPNFLTVFVYHYDPDFTTVLVPSKTIMIPPPYQCAGKELRPISNCWNVKNPY